MELVAYTPDLATLWEDFLATQALNGTMLHSRKFFDHNPANALDDTSLVYLKKNKIQALLPAVTYVRDGQKIFNSHLRSTYGGFVVGSAFGMLEAMTAVDLLLDYGRANNINQIIIRNPFAIFAKENVAETDWAMHRAGFTIFSREVEVCIPLLDKQTNAARYADNTSRNIKKAIASGIIVAETDDYPTVWAILEKNLMEKHGLKPVHSLADIQRLHNLMPNSIKLFGAFVDGVMIAATVTFVKNPLALHGQYFAIDSQYQQLRPMNLVIDFVVNWGIENGYRFYNLGTPNEDRGLAVNEGLLSFKESFGARGVMRETMQYTF